MTLNLLGWVRIELRCPRKGIFAHQGFFVYEALAHRSMIMCILASRRPVYNQSLLQRLTKVSVLNVFHYATMDNKTWVNLNERCFKSRSSIGRIESLRVQSDKALKVQQINAMRGRASSGKLRGPARGGCRNGNRARKSRRTLQNKVRLKVLPEQLTLFVNTFVAFKKCIIQ